jgi:MFS family permease
MTTLNIISRLISQNYFSIQGHRATALGFYNWGIYVGYSTAFAFNYILISIGWRWAFRIASFPGFIMALVLFIVVKEPIKVKPPEVSWLTSNVITVFMQLQFNCDLEFVYTYVSVPSRVYWFHLDAILKTESSKISSLMGLVCHCTYLA